MIGAIDWPYTAVLWTIRAALLCYAGSLAVWLVRPKNGHGIRLLWTSAWFLYILHVLAAFQFIHHWDHSHAVQHTADQTLEVVGVRFGGGIYFNHLLTLLWTADVAWWWLAESKHQRRPAWIGYTLQGYIFFLALNGSVVFESGVVRWVGLPIVLILVILFVMDRRRSLGTQPQDD